MTEAASGKSLKDQNRRRLWIVIAVNCFVLYAFSQARAVGDLDAKAIVAHATELLPVGIALAVVSVINGLVTADYKYRIVFLRWRHALPGHRAFTEYALSDPRIDIERIKEIFGSDLPTDPAQQNRVWFNVFYRKVENDPAVLDVHCEFLYTRDYTTLAALFLIAFGGAAFFVVPSWRLDAFYWGLLILQFVVVRQAAATYGGRFVCTVLARTIPS